MEKNNMIWKNKKLWGGTVVLAIILLFITAVVKKPQIDKNLIKDQSNIEYPSVYNYRQTKNDCGPFNVAAVVRALKGQDVDSASFTKEIGWRLHNDYTLPWGLEKQLKENEIKIEKPYFNLLTDDEKLSLVKEYLSAGKPIIVLGERDDYEHYITVLGFNAATDEYYIYDSLKTASFDQKGMTIDENEMLPGNATLSANEFLNFWRGGGMYGLWQWYGLVSSP